MLNEYFEDRIYTLYYNEVGQHDVVSPTVERELLVRYHTCPNCKQPLPNKAKTTNCPDCGAIATSPAVDGRLSSCTSCSSKFEIWQSITFCPYCGSARDLEARRALIVSNLRFVVRRAKKFTTNLDHLRRLISAGNVGLMLAIERFNISRSTRFLTYAEWWIRKEMLDEIHASRLIHIPTHRQKLLFKELNSGKYVCTRCGIRTTSPEDPNIPECVESEHDFFIPLNNDVAVLQETLSIDDLLLGTSADSSSEITAMDGETEQLLRDTLVSLGLGQRDLFILMGYFNVSKSDRQSESKTLPQLSRLTGITPERVRQIKANSLKLLRQKLKKNLAIMEIGEIC